MTEEVRSPQVLIPVSASPSGTGGASLGATVQMRRRIDITSNPRLQRIMLHEWNRPDVDSSRLVFDPVPLAAYVDSLSDEQVRFLSEYPMPPGYSDRLVIFLTRYREPLQLAMAFDDCKHKLHRPNASFAVFHCRGPGTNPTLVCYSRYFFIGSHCAPTAVSGRKSKRPHKLRVGTVLPRVEFEQEAHGVQEGAFYNRIYFENGTDMMPRNFWHGTINTMGCWSLFRNKNWPKAHEFALEDLYAAHRYDPARFKQEVEALAPRMGLPPGVTYDMDKLLMWDRNYAYIWFFREVVGIDYFSYDPYVNDHNIDCRSVLPLNPGFTYVPSSEPAVPKGPWTAPAGVFNAFSAIARNSLEKERRHHWIFQISHEIDSIEDRLAKLLLAHHAAGGLNPQIAMEVATVTADVTARRAQLALLKAENKSRGDVSDWHPPYKAKYVEWQPDDRLFGFNALGFNTARGFVPFSSGQGTLARTWADLYIFGAED